MTLQRKHILTILGIFIVTRLVLVLVGVIALERGPVFAGDQYKRLNASPVIDMWYRWDAGFYSSISLYGYSWAATHQVSADTVFLPLYPLSMRALNLLMRDPTAVQATVSGLLISNLALLLAAFLLYDVVKDYADDTVARRAVWLLMVAPGGIWLSGVYTESLFFLLSLLCFWALRREKFYLAVIAASAAFLTRPNGIALYACLLIYLWQKYRLHRLVRWIAAQAPLAAFGSYIAVTGLTTGVPFAYFSAYKTSWGRSLAAFPWETFGQYFSGQTVAFWGWRLSWLDLICAVAYVALAVIVLFREKDRLLGLFALTTVLVPILSGTLEGMPRYGSAVFPFYLVICRWADRPWRQVFVYGGSALLAIVFAARFVRWYWLA